MEIGLIIFTVALCLLCLFIGSRIGLKQKINEQRINNEAILLERKQIRKQVEDLKTQYDFLDSKIKKEKETYESLAKEAYNQKIEALMKDYDFKKNKMANLFSEQEKDLNQKLEKLKFDVDSLKKQKAATIEAFQKEEALKLEKDLYRLDISEQDKQDIKFLQSVQYRISKPRILAMLIWQTYYQPIAKKKFPAILGSQNICGIYKITNINNQKVYIGQAVDIRKRWMEHAKCGLGIDTPQTNKLYVDMLKDGVENFTFELLEECSKEELNKKEKYYIELYNSVDYGYNGTKGNS